MYVRCVVYVGKWLLVELHIKQTFIIIITPLSDVFLVTFWNFTPADIQL